MASTQSLSITLPIELAERVKAKVASGEYASESDVVSDGLLMLLDDDGAGEDPAIEKWLRDKLAPTIERIEAGTLKVRPLEEVRQRLHARIDRMVDNGK